MACFAEKSQQVHLCGAHHENGRRGARDRLRCDSRSPGKRLAVAATPIRARGFRGVAGCAKIDKIKKVRPVLVTGVTAPLANSTTKPTHIRFSIHSHPSRISCRLAKTAGKALVRMPPAKNAQKTPKTDADLEPTPRMRLPREVPTQTVTRKRRPTRPARPLRRWGENAAEVMVML